MKRTLPYIIFIVIFVMCLINNCHSQDYDTIHGFTLCKVEDQAIVEVLNEMTAMADSCPYFSALHKDYYILLLLGSDHCVSTVFPHNLTSMHAYRMQLPLKHQAICYHNGCIVHVQDRSDQDLLNQYFTPIDTTFDLLLKKNENVFEHIIPASMHFNFYYEKIDDTYIRDTSDDELLFEEWCGINDRMEFYYMVKHGDTWKTIAKKMGCKPYQLRKEYRELKDPIPGMFLFLLYAFDENGKFIGPKRYM